MPTPARTLRPYAATTALQGHAAVPALLPVAGADLRAPLVQGGTVRYAQLDVAASAPALLAVVRRVEAVLPYYASVHRGAGYASRVCTDLYEASRQAVGRFVGARPDDVVVLTRNTTDALCLLARAVPEGGSVVHLDVEHHANLLPWRGHPSTCVPARGTVEETLAALERELARRPAALLAVTGASNVTGEVLPLGRLARIAHRYGARLAVDAAQLAPHRRIDLAALDVDYVALSGHKLYAPYGAGALVGRRDWLDVAPPHLAGGGAVREVSTSAVEWAPAPQRHEGGTPNVLGAAALAAACDTLAALPPRTVERHERSLLRRLEDGLDTVPGLRRLRVWADAPDRVAVSSFVVEGQDSGKVAAALSAEHGIGVRDGRFCAHPLLARLSPTGTAVRASLGAGSTSDDVDRLVAALRVIVLDGPRWTYARSDAGWAPVPDPRDLAPLGFGYDGGVAAARPSPCEEPAAAAS